jgi:UDP-2-acetamido-3-amino-2,3-dideoxy-glucuronate N-acetyltransferase
MNSNSIFIHESSCVDVGATVGEGTKIWHFCHIMPGAKIGKNCNIGQNAFIAADVVIGNNVKIQNNVSVYTGVILEDDVFLGPSMVFTNVINPRSHVERKSEFQTTLVKRGATIGANATILCGISLGLYSFVGAGSVVTREVPDYALVYGNPARIKGWMCQCGVRLNFGPNPVEQTTTCKNCGFTYVRKLDKVIPSNT